MYKVFFLLFGLLLFTQASAQQKVTFSGTIKDKNKGETLIGTAVYLFQDSTRYGAMTDFDGNFSMEVPKGEYRLKIEYIGFSTLTDSVSLKTDVNRTFELSPDIITTQEVVVIGERKPKQTETTRTGEVELTIEEVKKMPSFMGETDIVKTLQLLPGVQSGGEGSTGIYVRGGGADQNLLLLDEAPLYSKGHLFGFFSVFNSDVISSVKLHKGNIPAYHSGRLSSVIEFDAAEGNNDSIRVEGGVGLIASRIKVDGPIKKDKATFLVAARRSYIDWVTKPFEVQEGQYGVPYYFYDINTKFNYKIDDNNELFWTFYNGRDGFTVSLLDNRFNAEIWWGNTASTLGWRHDFTKDLKMDLYFVYNRFRFVSNTVFDTYETKINSRVEEFHLKPRFRYYFSDEHRLDFGLILRHHYFIPRGIDAQSTEDETLFSTGQSNPSNRAFTAGVYISDKKDWNKKFSSEVGFAFNVYNQLGPYTYVTVDENGEQNREQYKNGEIVASYPSFEPRIGLKYSLDSVSSVKASFAVTTQFVHQVPLSGNSLPFDVWVPATRKIPVQRGDQYALGYYRDLKEGMITTSAEVYYRRMRNQLEYRQDYVPVLSGDFEDDFITGRGRSYGLELFVKKNTGKLTGWISYTLSKTDRYFDAIDDGKAFPFRYDRRHDLSITLSYEFNEHWTVGSNFIYSTGIATTMQVNRYFIEAGVISEYGEKNGYRYPPYHRLDLSITFNANRGKKVKSTWVLAVYNVYWRKNPYLIFIDPEENVRDGRLEIHPKMIYLFGIVPSLTWNFAF